jgi:hypothetical protein
MKREAIGHTKIKRLCRKLRVPHYAAIGILESLWHMTALESPQGNIGKLSNEDIAFGIDWKESEDDLINALVQSKWLDAHPEHRLIVHDWHEHCDDYVDMKVARSTLFYANGAKARMNRMSVAERAKIEENYALQNSIRAHGVQKNRTACQEPSPDTEHVFDRNSLVEQTVSIATQNGNLCAQNLDPCAQTDDPCAQNATVCAQNATTKPSLAKPSLAKPSLSLSLAKPYSAQCAEIPEAQNGAREILKTSPNGKAPEPTEEQLDEFSDWAHAAYQRHPRLKNKNDVLWSLKQHFANRPEDQKLFDENHALWIEYWKLDPKYPQYVPGLADRDGRGWINDQAWRQKPPPPPSTKTKQQIANDTVYQEFLQELENKGKTQ